MYFRSLAGFSGPVSELSSEELARSVALVGLFQKTQIPPPQLQQETQAAAAAATPLPSTATIDFGAARGRARADGLGGRRRPGAAATYIHVEPRTDRRGVVAPSVSGATGSMEAAGGGRGRVVVVAAAARG